MKQYPVLPERAVRPRNPHHRWLEKDYPAFLHTIFMQGLHAGVYLSRRQHSFAFRSAYCFLSRDSGEPRMDWFWDMRELERVRQLFLTRSKRTLKFFNQFYRSWEAHHRENMAVYQRAEKINWHRLSDSALYKEYQRLYWANVRQGADGYLADCFLSTGQNDWLSAFISSRLPVSMDSADVIPALTAPVIPTFINESQRRLERLLPSVKRYPKARRAFLQSCRRSPRVWRELEQHSQKYYWLENNYFAKVLTPTYFAGQLYELFRQSKHVPVRTIMQRNRQRKRAVLKKINDRWLTNVITMSEMMTHMQDYRKLALIRWSHFAHIMFREMARRRNTDAIAFMNVVEPEMYDFFIRQQFDHRKIRERIQNSFFYGTPAGYHIYEGANIRKYVRRSDFFPPVKRSGYAQGVTACPGSVTGTARIVMNAHQPGVFRKGDVLITNNTTPEFVPLMKKASAIVTEQGGITTHAAIVSRELRVPCIIGTQVATRVFKTGDRVAVDATKGVIKKI